jgi:hypothetical protein
MGGKQLHALPSIIINSSHQRVNIVLTKDGIHTLIDIVIVDQTRVDLLPQSCTLKDLLPPIQLKPKKGITVNNTTP